MRILPFVCFLLLAGVAGAQTTRYYDLVDTALRGAFVVYAKPAGRIGLRPDEMKEYARCLREVSGRELDTVMFRQIINNAATPDTGLWRTDELRSILLIDNRDDRLQMTKALQRLAPKNKQDSIRYRRWINEYNARSSTDRNITYLSRPVFDDSLNFAVIQKENPYGLVLGGGTIALYHYQDGAWKEVGLVSRWAY